MRSNRGRTICLSFVYGSGSPISYILQRERTDVDLDTNPEHRRVTSAGSPSFRGGPRTDDDYSNRGGKSVIAVGEVRNYGRCRSDYGRVAVVGPAGGHRSDMSVTEEYPYYEDVNEGVVRQFSRTASGEPRPRILDLGCGYGALGGELKSLGYEVWGVESSDLAVERARSRLDVALTGDITDADEVLKQLEGRFDYLVFSDILEHLRDPGAVLRAYLSVLNDDGRVVISVPNVANWQTRLGLLRGHFDYTDTGVLDRTHLRFFTTRSAREFVQQADLSVDRVDYTPLLFRALVPVVKAVLGRKKSSSADPTRAIIDSPLFQQYMRFIYPLEYALARMMPGLFAFRIILVASVDQTSSTSATVEHVRAQR